MKKKDARSLSTEAQEIIRIKVVKAIKKGLKVAKVARIFDVSRQSASSWYNLYLKNGWKSLKSKPKGRPRQSRLKPHEASLVVRLIKNKCPDQLCFPFYLWTREAVMHLIFIRFNFKLSKWTVGRYLKKWGFTPQKPVRKAYEQNPAEVKKWLEEEYPRINKLAKSEDALIYWGDEMGLRSDHQTGTTYGKCGKTPVIYGTGKRFKCNMISAITNRGNLSFMIYNEKFTANVFIKFLRRLIKHVAKKIFFITDSHPVHKSGKVVKWIEKYKKRIRMFYLPTYSPELNPDELLNNDIKSNALGRKRPRNQEEMAKLIRSLLRSRNKMPQIVKNYFKKDEVKYAA
jgi:transposase